MEKKNRSDKQQTEDSAYPQNWVIQMPGGHRLEIGNEPGKECVKFYGAGGQYMEFMPNGSKMEVVIGDAVSYYKGGKTETVDENSDSYVAGHSRTTIAKGEHKEVVGDSGTVVGGKSVMYSKGQMSVGTQKGMYLAAGESIGMNAAKGMTINVKGDMELNVTGALKIKGDGGVTVNGQTIKLNPSGESSGSSEYSGDDVPSV